MIGVDEFQSYRPLLFSIAYRMLGSASDAEDVLQDAWVRSADAQPSDLRSPKSWLTTVVSRLCLDRLKSARATREQYIGPWLPEPVLTAAEERPDAMLQRHESVTLAFLVLLETLSPEERAVFLLKEVFEYSHDEIAGMLEMTAANARQILHRARERITERRPRFTGDPDAKRAMAERFVAALAANDPQTLTGLLADDVGFWGDGGGKVTAAKRPLSGREAVLNLLQGFHRVAAVQGLWPKVSIRVIDVNFEPAVEMRIGGRLDSIYALEIDDGAIHAIRAIRNPDKLAFIDRQLSVS
jgi:RNA polymerase sigma-70 factor (TIGR02957 family)